MKTLSKYDIPEPVYDLMSFLSYRYNMTPLITGGAVRDLLLGREPNDYDIEVFGNYTAEELDHALKVKYPAAKEVGNSFGVYEVIREPFHIQVSIPRTENKIGPKHTDYNTTRTNDIVEAALRRDLTINAMFLTMSGSILDPMDGMPHLKAGVLHPTSDRFLEDSLRVLRVFQLASRLDFFPSQSLIEISRRALDDFSYLSKERIGEEWWKWATKSINPERGLQYLLDCGALERFYPSLFAMTTTPQNPKWHPEGSVWIHTLKALGAVKHYVLPVQDRVALIFSVLLHDIGKPITTEFDEEGRLMSKDHAHAAISQHLISDFAKAIRMPGSIENMVEVLVDTHMSKIQEMGKPGIRRLARKLEEKGANIGLHLRLRQCDRIGQGLSEVEAHQEFVENWERAESFLVGLHSPVPVLMGRHLIEAGLVDPGPTMGRILKMVFELQLDGEVETVEQGLEKAKEILTASE